MIDQPDRRRHQSIEYETPAERQVTLLKLTAFVVGETTGPVMHATFVDHAKYPNAAGPASLDATLSPRTTLCWVQSGQFAVNQIVIAVSVGERYFAIGALT